MPTLPNRLRQAAQFVWQGELYDLLIEAAGALEGAEPVEMSPEFTGTARAALLWILYHHQGGSSKVGQPIRFALGMGAHEYLNDHQLREAKRWGELEKKAAAPQPQERKPVTDEQLESVYEAARRSFIRHSSGVRGQQLTAADSLDSHVIWAAWAECCKTHGIKE